MFRLEFETDNAAFDAEDGDPAGEVRRILHSIGERVRLGVTEGNVLDVNGNTVGSWSWDQTEGRT